MAMDYNKLYNFNDVTVRNKVTKRNNLGKYLMTFIGGVVICTLGTWLVVNMIFTPYTGEKKLYDKYGLSASKQSSSVELYEEIRDNGRYVDIWEIYGHKLTILRYEDRYYGLWEDGSGLMLPKND